MFRTAHDHCKAQYAAFPKDRAHEERPKCIKCATRFGTLGSFASIEDVPHQKDFFTRLKAWRCHSSGQPIVALPDVHVRSFICSYSPSFGATVYPEQRECMNTAVESCETDQRQR